MNIKIFLGLIFLLLSITDYAYNLPENYDPSETRFNVSSNPDGTYNFYLKKYPTNKLYQSREYDLDGMVELHCGGNINITGGLFNYAFDHYTKMIFDAVFFNPQTEEISNIFSGSDFICPIHQNVMIDADNNDDPNGVIIHPIFPSQPKIWIVFDRDYEIPFPGYVQPGTNTKFLDNGNLYLVLDADGDPNYSAHATRTETIPIDYSIFNQKVDKPTCYAIPEDHKIRPCTIEEAKLRTPGLKVFLGEK